MSDIFIARCQFALTIIWFIGFFGILVMAGLGKLDLDTKDLFYLTSAVIFFWFNRPRQQESQPANTQITKQNIEPITTEEIKK